MFSFFSKGQTVLEPKFLEANALMSARNMYQKITWGMSAMNEYLFDQTEGYVKYIIEEKGMEVFAVPEIMGTFNMDDNTFLWADKNPSIKGYLVKNVKSFREGLPKKYEKDKFKSTADFNSNLLASFSEKINANGFDTQRQDNTIIYYALLSIDIFENGIKIKTIEPTNHITPVENEPLIALIKEFHKEKVEINRLHNANIISLDEAFKRIKSVHLSYWLNEDEYHRPSLSWPCEFDEKSVKSWKVFTIEGNRLFIMYSTDLGWTTEYYAYEIDGKASGKKIIINEY